MHPSLRKLQHSNYESWEVVFKAPEDPRWHVVKDPWGTHGLQHNCERLDPEPRYTDNDACCFCGDVPPDSLVGFLTLIEWER